MGTSEIRQANKILLYLCNGNYIASNPTQLVARNVVRHLKQDNMKYLSIIILTLIILISCHNKSNSLISHETVDSGQVLINNNSNTQNKSAVSDKFKSHIKLDFAANKDKINDTNNILTIDKVCAITIDPDTNWINNQQKTMDEGTWNESALSNSECEQTATDTLTKYKIPTVYASRVKRYIKFCKKDWSEYIIDLNKMPDAWGLILFNKTDNPDLWYCSDIDEGLKEVYEK